MRQMTVCFLLRNAPEMEVLLGLKKAGFGAGRYAGIGGKVEAGETVEAAALREVAEEIGVEIPEASLLPLGQVTFLFPSRAEWNQQVAIFAAKQWLGEPWLGEPVESAEMKPFWFKPAEIPYHCMWQDAAYWLPFVLDGIAVEAKISFKADNETVDEVFITPLPLAAS